MDLTLETFISVLLRLLSVLPIPCFKAFLETVSKQLIQQHQFLPTGEL